MMILMVKLTEIGAVDISVAVLNRFKVRAL